MKSFLSRYTGQKTVENPLWLIVLSDIMTNLMLFFLILYVFNIQPESEAKTIFMNGFDKEHAEAQKARKAENVVQKYREQDMAKNLEEELAKAGLKNAAEVQMTEKQIRINIAAPVLFASGKARLNTSSAGILGALAKVLTRLPNDIIIEGHTDNVPIRSGDYSTNWELSSARATAVADFLAAKFAISNTRMICAAYGEYRPVALNDTPKGRALNRRIEIIVSRK
ncbi:MAG: OmpA family protein [Elusimicrobia bacterium]|nr:OmpA family protein [Elusimicrobiota bacterium]